MRDFLAGGLKMQPPGYAFRTDDYDIIQAIVVLGGRVVMRTEGVAHPMRRGMAMLLVPGSAFQLFCRDAGYHGVFASAPARPDPACARPVCFAADAGILQTARDLRAEALRAGPSEVETLPLLERLLLARVERAARSLARVSVRAPDPHEWTRRVQRLIRANLYTSYSLEKILASLTLGRRQLARHFRACTGATMKHWQTALKVEEAKRLLANPTIPVISVAMELGYPSSQHFATQFKARTGQTPRAYRAAAVISEEKTPFS